MAIAEQEQTSPDYRKVGGMEWIQIVKDEVAADRKPYEPRRKLTVGGFGFVYPGGYIEEVHWVVSDRRDRRHGVVDRPAPATAYGKSLLEEMFRKW